ncbi:MAG: hypothetical protein R8K50_06020 [Mariprofundus sp.]
MSLSFSDAAKAKQLREYFNRYGRIYIVVDATGDDVELPDNLKGDPALRLVLSLRMPQQIHIRDDRLESDFSFSGQVYACRIPMHTIWGAYQPEGELEQGIIWEDSVPEMIRSLVQEMQSSLPDADVSDVAEVTSDAPEASPSPIRLVESASDTTDTAQPDTGEADVGTSPLKLIESGSDKADDLPVAARKKGHLRVVK